MTPLTNFLHAAVAFVAAAPIIIQIVAGTLGAFVIFFALRFLIPALLLQLRLGRVAGKLRRLDGNSLADIQAIFAGNKTLAHLWKEYRETLHEQRSFDAARGELSEPVYRATIPASMAFTTDSMVDSRINAEFFKHLPGLFTGIGIIGTFSGLIQGLQAFKVSEDASIVRSSLEVLMHGVYEAFMVSAAAIVFAMVATFLEKFLVASLYKKVEAITFELDRMFQSGAGEEYLARLVKSSEESSAQTKILKDSLVADLKAILSDLTEKQIKAQSQGSEELAQKFSSSLTEGLKAPLDRIADTFSQTSQGNSQAVTTLLTDVLAGFSQKLEDLFGGQISGINQLQQQTVQALQAAVTKLEQMSSGIEAAGTRTSEAMGQKLSDAMTAMEARQKIMNERMTEFVEQIRGLIGQSQNETTEKLQTVLGEIGEAASAQLALIQAQGERASAAQQEREAQLATTTQAMLGQFSSQIETAVGSLRQQSEQAATTHAERERRSAEQADETLQKLAGIADRMMAEVRVLVGEVRSTVDAVRGVTSDAVTRMNSGAEMLYLAADEFSKAGQSVSGVLRDATAVSEKLAQAAGSVTSSSTMLQGVVADYAATRETLAKMLGDLRATVENARTEAALTSDVLGRIESAAQKLGDTQRDAEEYLAGVTDVLARAHGEFSESLKKVLGDSYREFYERLSAATGLLSQAVQELAVAVEPPVQRRA